MPVGYQDTYFARFDNIWSHDDYVDIYSAMYGLKGASNFAVDGQQWNHLYSDKVFSHFLKQQISSKLNNSSTLF